MFLTDLIDLYSGLAKAKVVTRTGGLLVSVPKVRVAGLASFTGDGEWLDVLGYCSRLAPKLKAAKAYRFENAPVDHVGGRNIVPPVDPDACRRFNDDLLPPPAEVCWFECETSPGNTLGLLVETNSSMVEVREFNRIDDHHGTVAGIICYSVVYHRSGLSVKDRHPDLDDDVDAGVALATVTDPLGHFRRLMAFERGQPGGNVDEAILASMMIRESLLALHFTKALHDGEGTRAEIFPGKFSNARRVAKGLAPVPVHTVVTLPARQPAAQPAAAVEPLAAASW